MKRKLIIILLIPTLLLVITGCGKEEKKTEKTTKDTSVKTIELSDKGFGFKTTFTYDSKEDFTKAEIDTESGKSTQISFENEELDLEFEMYYTEMMTKTYEDTQNTRSKQKYYKEYKFNDYKAYAYGEYSSGLYLNILIDTDKEKDMAKVLFVSIDRLDTNEDIVVSDVVSKDKVQKLFKSMKVEKIK